MGRTATLCRVRALACKMAMPGARGNIVTEDFVFMLEEMGLSTGIDLPKLMETRAILQQHIPAEHLTGHLHEAGIPKLLRRAA